MQTNYSETSSSGRQACQHTARAEYHLLAWARWMRGGAMRKLWHQTRASGGLQSSASRDLDEMADDADMRAAEVCDTVIGDLPRCQYQAIHKQYLRTAYTCKESYHETLAGAVVAVGKGLFTRGVTYP